MLEMLIVAQSMMSLTVFFLTSPLFLALALITLSAIQGATCFFLVTKWVGVSLVLVFVGGMMVVFLYVTSLAHNTKILRHPGPQAFTLLALVLGLLWKTSPLGLLEISLTPSCLFSVTGLSLLMFIVFYVLMVLFLATKIPEGFKGALVEKL